MSELRKNHYIPRFILNSWASDGPRYRGVWVYEIEKARKYFSAATGGSAYSFAIDLDLYVPMLLGERATAMERWFSKLEGSLATLIRQAGARSDEIKAATQGEWIAATMGLFGLEARSKFNVQHIRSRIESDPEVRAFLADNPDKTAHQLVLENIIHYVSESASEFNPIEIEFLHSASQKLIYSDRPFFNSRHLPHRFVALTSTCFAGYQRSPSGFARYRHNDANQDLIATLNREIALNARSWIVAQSEAQLDTSISVVTSDAWKTRANSDRVELVPLKRIAASWSIPPDAREP
jgi:hypothetical protein